MMWLLQVTGDRTFRYVPLRPEDTATPRALLLPAVQDAASARRHNHINKVYLQLI